MINNDVPIGLCPRCGGTGTPVRRVLGGFDYFYTVECERCGARTYSFSSAREALRAWNAGNLRPGFGRKEDMA